MEQDISQNNEGQLEEIKEEQKRELQEYENIEERLKEIEEEVSTKDLGLDESLQLYEEAVDLGMKASKTIENNVLVDMNAKEEDEEEQPQE